MTKCPVVPFMVLWTGLVVSPSGVQADPVRNGNDVALAFMTAKPAARAALSKERTGMIHTFRYLRITDIRHDEPSAGKATVVAVEPSSDMQVNLVVAGAVSMKLLDTLGSNDCVAANGRIRSLAAVTTPLMVIDPAILKFKDRPAPKLNNELLNEVDTTAH